MDPEISLLGDLAGLTIGSGAEEVTDGRLPRTGVPRQQCHAVRHLLSKFVDADFLSGGDDETAVADALIERLHPCHLLALGGTVPVDLIEYQDCLHIVCLCRRQEAIDEGGPGDRIIDRHEEDCPVEVGRQDVGLLGEIDRLAHNVVPPVRHCRDPAEVSILRPGDGKGDKVSYRDRIGRLDVCCLEVSS